MDPVDLASRLIAIPSLSGEEGKVADLVAAAMLEAGFRDVKRTPLGSVVGIAGPPGDVAALFDAHMDVVPPTGSWTEDPFTPTIRDDRLYGRGATDTKGGLAAAIVGVGAAAARLGRPVAVSSTVLEETIEGVALGEVLDLVEPDAVVICEPSSLQVKIAQRGRIEIRLEARGVPAHAAHPERGSNPIDHMARALRILAQTDPPEDDQLGPGILVATDVVSDPFPSISLIPRTVTVRFDRRTLPGEESGRVLEDLVRTVDHVAPGRFSAWATSDTVTAYTGATIAPRRVLAPWRIDPEHPLVQTCLRAVTTAGAVPELGVWGFCTNGSESAGRGIPTIGFGPGRESDAHLEDESVSVTELQTAAVVYRHLARSLARELT